jgi:hypothetical protein
MYQRFDQGFVGLIFSVFNTTPATQEQTVQLTAFQAVQGAAAAGQQQQLEVCCSSDLDGLDEQMRAALAASAAGGSHGSSSHAVEGFGIGVVHSIEGYTTSCLSNFTECSATDACCRHWQDGQGKMGRGGKVVWAESCTERGCKLHAVWGV